MTKRCMSVFAVLLLSLAPLAAATAEPEDREVYTVRTDGELTIDATGAVVDVQIDPLKLGEEAIASYEQRIRGWRFEPVVHDGQPVAAKAKFNLGLIGVREPGIEGVRLGVEDITFYDEADGDSGAMKARFKSMRAHPPRYPSAALRAGVGARVVAWARIAADGSVADVGIESVSVHHPKIAAGDLPRWGKSFADATSLAVSGWRYPGMEGRIVKVPLRFNTPSQDATRWMRTWGVPVELPAWIQDAEARRHVVTLDESGKRASATMRLVAQDG